MRLRSFPSERQYDMMDCGPACLKIIAKYYGKYYSMQYLRDKCGITKKGTALFDLSYGAENIGLRTLAVRVNIHELYLKVPLPCIAHWKGGHFIVIYKVSKDKVFVSDPVKGLISYSYSAFIKNWYNENAENGILLVLEPQADFYLRQPNEKISRRKTFYSILSYFRPYKKSFINLCLVMLFVTLLQGILPFISKAVIDVGIQTHDIGFINIMIIANIAIILSIMLSNAVRDWIMLHVTSRLNIALISDYLMKLMKLPISFFETKLTGDILQRANDHERIRHFITNNSLSLVFSFLTFIIFGVILMMYNTLIFYIFLAGSILFVIWVLLFFKIRRKLDWEYFELVSRNQSYWVEMIEGMQDIKINNYERVKRWKWEDIQARLYKVNINVLSVNNIQNLGAQFINNLKNLLITFYCAKAVIAGEMTFGAMISTQFIIGMLNGPVIQFIQFIISAQFAQISFMRLNEIHQLEGEDENVGSNPVELPEDKSLRLNNVFFQYSSNAQMVLKGIYLTIPLGKVTAIVGDSGSGKSTLLKLLLRLYKPSYGEIMMGSMNINNISLKQWRDICGAVMQDGKVFNDTVLNNIVLNDERIDYEQLKYAVETANINQEIEKMPLGYQTALGERGHGISGGQKQRILIARALYRNPEYLFLDEATNSLDSINEQQIVAALEKAFVNKTVVVVAHRLSTVRKADQIIVMQDGKIVEIGSHDILIERKGKYYQLVQSQVNILSPLSDDEEEESFADNEITA